MRSRTGFRGDLFRSLTLSGAAFLAGVAVFALGGPKMAALAQAEDCAGLQSQIAALDRGAQPNRYAAEIQRRRPEFDRAVAYARSLGCDRPQIPFFETPVSPRCPGLNAQIQQMQSDLGRFQAAAQSEHSAARAGLIARFNAYCRAPVQAAPRPRNFFEQLFGGGFNQTPQSQLPVPGPDSGLEADQQDEGRPRGGSQAVCVRTCDGGFFPLTISARSADEDQLKELCQALCPNTPVSVYTKSPNAAIETAASLGEGAAYSDLPNALKFRTSFDAACTCKPPDQSWAQALAGAERLLGRERKGDILVNEQKANELSAPRPSSSGPSAPAASGRGVKPQTRNVPQAKPGSTSETASAPGLNETPEGGGDSADTEGVRRDVRKVGPPL
ncbi:DUF2865 domain-containing protein [Methylocapsa palsarum]|uniref:DUF2865 domain-containing protein n=1 Tax=Methylocapsa palsarum TaxID=1612308 RepID=A0A1I3ZQI3_9HYPH|nr:DUF2865 domain-containing protein [Methylocapsa palsarum]SFK46140.1 Protein of unknown function [Methylocapsa palsarum]